MADRSITYVCGRIGHTVVRRVRDERGLSVIEIVIASALASVLLLSTFAVLGSSTRVAHGQQSQHEATIRLREAMARITKDTRQALALSTSSTRDRIDMQTLVAGEQVHVIYELSDRTLSRRSCIETNTACVVPIHGLPLATNVTEMTPFCYDPPSCVLSGPTARPESVRISLTVAPDDAGKPIAFASEVSLRNIGRQGRDADQVHEIARIGRRATVGGHELVA